MVRLLWHLLDFGKLKTNMDLVVTSLYWLENDRFLNVYCKKAAGEESDSMTVLVTRQGDQFKFQKLAVEPTFPGLAARAPPHYFVSRLRKYEPNLNDTLFISNSISSDIGVIVHSKSALSKDSNNDIDSYSLVTMEEDSRKAAMPSSMADDMSDTDPIVIGMEIDLSSKEPVKRPIPKEEGLEQTNVPLPALIVLNHEGALAAWWFVNNASILQNQDYQGMHMSTAQLTEHFAARKTTGTAAASPATPVFGQTGFNSPGVSTMGAAQTSPWSSSQPGAKFGQSSFGNPSFGTPSAPTFGSPAPLRSAQSPFASAGGGSDAPIFGQKGNQGDSPSKPGGFQAFATQNAASSSPFGNVNKIAETNLFGSSKQTQTKSFSSFSQGQSNNWGFGQQDSHDGSKPTTLLQQPSTGSTITIGSSFSSVNAPSTSFGGGKSSWATPSLSNNTSDGLKTKSTSKEDEDADMDMDKKADDVFDAGISSLGLGKQHKDDSKPSVETIDDAKPEDVAAKEESSKSAESLEPEKETQPEAAPLPPDLSVPKDGPPKTPEKESNQEPQTISKQKPERELKQRPEHEPEQKPEEEPNQKSEQEPEQQPVIKPTDSTDPTTYAPLPVSVNKELETTSRTPEKSSEEAEGSQNSSQKEEINLVSEAPASSGSPKQDDIKKTSAATAAADTEPAREEDLQSSSTTTALPESPKEEIKLTSEVMGLPEPSMQEDAKPNPALPALLESPKQKEPTYTSNEPQEITESPLKENAKEEEHEEISPVGSEPEIIEAEKSIPASPTKSFTSDFNDTNDLHRAGTWPRQKSPVQPTPTKPLFGEQTPTGTFSFDGRTPQGSTPSAMVQPPVFFHRPDQSPRSPSPVRQQPPHGRRIASPTRRSGSGLSPQRSPAPPPQERTVSSPAPSTTATPRPQHQYRPSSLQHQITPTRSSPVPVETPKPERVPSPAPSVDFTAAEDAERRVHEGLESPVKPTTTLKAFTARIDYVNNLSGKSEASQIERLYRDGNSIIDSLAVNARTLREFIQGHEELYKEGERDVEDLEGEHHDSWTMDEIDHLRLLVKGQAERLNANGPVDVKGTISELRDLQIATREMRTKIPNFASQIADVRASVDGDYDTGRTGRPRAKLSAQQAAVLRDLRREHSNVQTLLAQAEDSTSLLRAKLVAHEAQNVELQAASVPTYEAVISTITKMTRMIEEKRSNVDVLEAQLKKMKKIGVWREGSEDLGMSRLSLGSSAGSPRKSVRYSTRPSARKRTSLLGPPSGTKKQGYGFSYSDSDEDARDGVIVKREEDGEEDAALAKSTVALSISGGREQDEWPRLTNLSLGALEELAERRANRQRMLRRFRDCVVERGVRITDAR